MGIDRQNASQALGTATSHVTARPMSFGEAHATLARAQKTNRGAPAYSRWVNRPAGRVLAAAAYRIGLNPNQVTGVSAAFTYTAIALVAVVRPTSTTSVMITLLLLVGYALDSADGQLARLTKMGRPSGEWLDHVIDMGKLCLLNAAIALSWFRWGAPGFGPGVWTVALPWLYLSVGVVSFFGWLLADLLNRISREKAHFIDRCQEQPIAAEAPALRSVLRLPSDYGLFALTFLWFDWPAFPVTYGALLAANTVILTAALPTWYRQVRDFEGTA